MPSPGDCIRCGDGQGASGILARMPRRTARVAVALLALALALGACSGGDDDSDSASTDDDAPVEGEIDLKVGDVVVESLGDPAELPRQARNRVLEQVQRYVDEATLAPLIDGEPADLRPLFADTVAGRIGRSGRDRGALTDDLVPAASESIEARAKPVQLSALADGAGGWVMVGATVDYTVDATVDGGPVTIHRVGDLYLAPSGKSWKIVAYDMGVGRETEDGSTSTTADTTESTNEDGSES
jgi:hypothetical protein